MILRLNKNRQQRWWAAKFVVIAVVASVTGCNTIRTVSYSAGPPTSEELNSAGRIIEVEIDPEYFSDRPNCVLLVPIKSSTHTAPLKRLIENYFALHLRFRFDRVIFGKKRDRFASSAGLNFSQPEDRLLFHAYEGCGYEIALQLFVVRSDFAVVWAQLSLGLEAQLTRASDGHLLWTARHTAARSEGGIAISPLSAVSNSMAVAAFISDGDQVVSLVADLTRRVTGTLPPIQDQSIQTTDLLISSRSPSP